MCIIIAKKKNAQLPTKRTMKICFDKNPDGAGFMYVNNNKVIIDKGYMTFKSFYKRFQELKLLNNNFDNKALVIHFRIGTSGTNSPENTHPYPITNDVSALHSTYYICNLGMAHNGIISDYTHYLDKNDMNDTQHFIAEYVTKLYRYIPEFYKDKDLMLGLEKISASRLCFMNTDEELYFVGDWHTDLGNLEFSNTNYKEVCYNSYTATNHWRDYNYDYYHNDYSYYDDYKYIKNGEFLPVDTTIITANGGSIQVESIGEYSMDKDYNLWRTNEDGTTTLEFKDVSAYDTFGREVVIW